MSASDLAIAVIPVEFADSSPRAIRDNGEFDAERVQNGVDRFKARIGPTARRLIEAFPSKAGFSCNLRHPARLGGIAKRREKHVRVGVLCSGVITVMT